MKLFFGKYFAVFFLFGGLILFAACQTPPARTEMPKGDYPPAPQGMMQAVLTKIDGTTFKPEDLRGKVVLINLWATWCAPCRQEIPEFIELQEEYGTENFEIIGLNVDEQEDSETIKKFGEQMQINYPLAKGEPELFREFLKISKADVIPQSFLIDREGRLVGVFVGGGKTVEKIKTNVKRFVG